MDIKEREVVQITDRTDETNAGVNILLALVLGALIVFLVYLVSSTAISTWYPVQNTEYRVERNTTITPPAVTIPEVTTPAPSATTESTTTTTESTTQTETSQ